MKKLLFILLLINYSLFAKETNILCIHSYDESYPWTKEQRTGFRETLDAAPGLYPLYSAAYLDTKRRSFDKKYEDESIHYMRSKYEGYLPDIIYVTDDNALKFVINNRQKLFPKVKVVFSGINDHKLADSLPRDSYTGVYEEKEVIPSFKLIKQLFPKERNVMLVGDGSPTAEIIRATIEHETSMISGMTVRYLNNQSLDFILHELNTYPGKNIILTTIGGFHAKNGELVPLREAINKIVNTRDFRVFSLESSFIKDGVIGGHVDDGITQGREAGKIVLQILNHPNSPLPQRVEDSYSWIFDAHALAKHNITLPNEIAEHSKFLNPDPSFYHKHQDLIINFIYGLIATIFVSSALFIWNLYSSRKMILKREQEIISISNSLNKAQELAHFGNWTWDIQANTVWWSDEVYRIFGLQPQVFPVNYEIFLEFIHPDDRKRVDVAINDALDKRSSYHCIHRIIISDGSIRDVLEEGMVLCDDRRNPIKMIGTVQDITEQTVVQKQLILAKESAEDSARSKSEFLAAMSHEIRTPMNGVLGMLGLLEHSPLDNTQRHRVHVAQSSATSLLGLINDILDFSKIEAGKMDLENIEFNLRDELGEFAEAIAFRAQEKGLELILDTTQVHMQNIVADPGRLRQIMTNIVGNSVKFTNQGHILIRVSIETIDETHGRLLIDITDTGIGIPAEKIETMFEAFSQADGSTTRKYGGTGLGLSIVKRLCELMGGSVKATSIPHQGSTFSIEVEIGFGTNREQVIPAISVEGKTVLIIDDNEVNRAVVRAQLEQWGMITDEAEDAMSAFDKCQVQISKGHIPPYDVALVDMQMPDMDGAQLGQEIRKITQCDSMKMVMMTSLGSRHDAKIFADLGFNAFFAKPTTAKDLLNALKVLFDNGEALRSADPLLTKDYLGTLKDEQSNIVWPESTRILLVEDNTTNQLVAQGMLESIGLRADIAANGLEALESLQLVQEESVPYTFILMDCQMPEMDGYTASTAIRAGKAGEANKKIPIVAMTANAMSGDREKCILAGMDDYVSKPINLSVLKAMLSKWILKDEAVELPHIEKNETETILERTIPTQLPLWDEADALHRLGNNSTLLNKVIQSFMSDGPKSLALLNEAIQQNNSEDTQLHTHSLKGSAGNVGALKLQEMSKHLEESAKNKSMTEVQAGFSQCEKILHETLKLFEAHLAKEVKPTVRKKCVDPLQMAIKLQGLKKQIEDGIFIDTDAVGIFVEYADEVFTQKMNDLKSHINSFEMDKAKSLIEQMMEGLE